MRVDDIISNDDGQILEVNGVKFHPISLTKAMDTLKTGKKFSISVQSNLQGEL